jgi:hypothetical protein
VGPRREVIPEASKDATSFTVVQMMFATLVLAAFVALLVFWQSVLEYCRSLWKTR